MIGRRVFLSLGATLLMLAALESCNLFTNTSADTSTSTSTSTTSVNFWAATLKPGDGGKIEGVSVRVTNNDKTIENAQYDVLLSLNDLNAYSATLYRGTATIPSGESTIEVSWDSQIAPFLESNGTQVSPDYYRVGFQFDPNKLTDNSWSDGQAICPNQLWIIGNSPCAYVASGTIGVDPVNDPLAYDDGSGSMVDLPDGGYDLYVGFVSPDSLSNPLSGSIDPTTLFLAGWNRQTFSYDTAYPVSTTAVRCGVPASGTYVLVAFVDANRNGKLDVSNGNPAEPVAVSVDLYYFQQTAIHVNDDIAGLMFEWTNWIGGIRPA